MRKRFDYTWSCDCGTECTEYTKRDAEREARKHLKTCTEEDAVVFIDQYDLIADELSGVYCKIKK